MTPREFVLSLEYVPTVQALLEIEGWYVGNAWQDGLWGEGGYRFVKTAEAHLRNRTFKTWIAELKAQRKPVVKKDQTHEPE